MSSPTRIGGSSAHLSQNRAHRRPGAGGGAGVLSIGGERPTISSVKLLLENLPASLQDQHETLAKCLEAMDRALPLTAVYLFGSHARGEARPDSDVDLCLVAEGASEQLKAAAKFREAMWGIHRAPPFTLIPITPQRLDEKKAVGDYFFDTVLTEGVLLATKN